MRAEATSKALIGDLLFRTAVFEGLGRRRCDLLTRHAIEREYARGEIACREDSPSDGLLILAQGSLRLSVATGLGNPVLMRVQAAPAAIITAGLLDGGPNGVTAVASCPCVMHVVLRDSFIRYCGRHPDLLIRLVTEIGGHLRRTSAFIDLIIATGTRQRLARALLDLMDEAGTSEFVLPCNHAELAARLGTVRELIYRNLKLLEARGILSFSGKHIAVTDAVGLMSEAGRPAGSPHVFESHGALPNPACFILEPAPGPRPSDTA